MRIIAGNNRGAILTKLGALNTRPTAGRVRESLFNILDGGRFGRAITGARVIDALAGTGALGIEALSRGAATACFIEKNYDALRVLRTNIDKLDMQGCSTIIAGDAVSLSHWSYPPATIMFADAPYNSGAGQASAIAIHSIGGLARQAVVIIETHKSETLDHKLLSAASMMHNETRTYGKAALHFITYNG